MYPGLNDFSDALEALPLNMIHYFTLLKEIDSKCGSMDTLAQSIKQFTDMDTGADGREELLSEIRRLLVELIPCLEEKMHVASMAAESMNLHIDRVNADFKMIQDHEIPQDVQIDLKDPAISEPKPVEKQSSSAARSEARREAVAARKAAQQAAAESRYRTESSNGNAGGAKQARVRRWGPPGSDAGGADEPGPQAVLSRGGGEKRRRRDAEDANDTSLTGPPQPPSRRRHDLDKNEPVYCYCEQGSYGDMVGCDGPDCKREWFHLGCIGLSAPPKGQWFCEDCQARYRRR